MNIKTEYLIYFFSALITFFLTGLWHGASWNFVLWGLFHGLLLIADRFLFKHFFKKIGTLPSTMITFFLVLTAWVLFRIEAPDQIKDFYHNMFVYSNSDLLFPFSFKVIFILGLIITFLPSIKKIENKLLSYYDHLPKRSFILLKTSFSLLLLILCMSEVVSTGFNPFIYFRF